MGRKKRGKKEKKKMDENQPVPDILLVLRTHILGFIQKGKLPVVTLPPNFKGRRIRS